MKSKAARAGTQNRNRSGQCGLDWDELPLGGVSDSQLARDLRVTSGAVRKARTKRGIRVFDPYKGLGLGKRSDPEIAKELGVSRRAVSTARKRRGLRGPKTVDWDNQPLGEVSDTALARVLGLDQTVVSSARRRRGIPRGDLHCLTHEGESATYPEALIDLFWHEKGVGHQFQVPVGRYVADWVIGNTVVEYAGFGEHRTHGEAYLQRLEKKKAFYISGGWRVLIILPQELGHYDLGAMPNFQKKHQTCSDCGARFGIDKGPLGGLKHHQAHGKCKSCYRKS